MNWKQFMMSAVLMFGIGTGLRAFTQEGDPAPANVFRVTDPEWIVVYNVKSTNSADPVFNFRVVIHAKSDGEAVMKATLYIQSKFGVNATDVLDFVEVAPRAVKK